MGEEGDTGFAIFAVEFRRFLEGFTERRVDRSRCGWLSSHLDVHVLDLSKEKLNLMLELLNDFGLLIHNSMELVGVFCVLVHVLRWSEVLQLLERRQEVL